MIEVPLNKLCRTALPPELIIDGFIENYPDVGHENYLTEFINHSSLFLVLSEGQAYQHIPKSRQSNAECDCCSDAYKIDFKRLGTMSALYAKRNLSQQKVLLAPGVMASCIPRQTDGMEITLTSPLMQRYSLEDLLNIDGSTKTRFNRNKLSPELDVKGVLDSAKCDKNVVFFCLDFVSTEEDFPFESIVKVTESYLNRCFSALFNFRDRFVRDKDTYLAVIVQGYMCFAIWNRSMIQFKDFIPLSKSPIFIDLYETINEIYSKKMIIR